MTLDLPGLTEYRNYFVVNFARRPLVLRANTQDIPVYFKAVDFDHAFFESTQRNGTKDEFSFTRARRMDDIPHALGQQVYVRYAGWHSKRTEYVHDRCVTVAHGDFVVVVRLGLKTNGALRGKFVTCYVADNSINKILKSPIWDEQECIRILTRRAQKGR